MSEIEKLEGAIADLLSARNADSLTEYPKNETLDTALQALREKLERGRESDGWKPIETAPKDRDILLQYPESFGKTSNHTYRGRWNADAYREKPRPYWTSYELENLLGMLWMRRTQPTHWMPLPEPPKEGKA